MPSAQVIDLNPPERTQQTPLEKTLSGFSKRNQENQETDVLKDIYSKYQQDGNNIQQAFIGLQTRPGLSPTTRVNSTKQLLELQKHNSEMQKKARLDMEKSQKENANKMQVMDIAKKRNIPESEAEAYVANPKLFEQISRPEKQKPAPGGLAGIPLSPKESASIERVLSENPDASAEELEVAFNKTEIAPGRTKALLESRRRIQEQTSKNQETEKKLTRREELDFHRESQKYDEELTKNAKVAKKQIDTVNDISKALESKNVRPTSIASLFKGFGVIGDKISEAALTGDQATLLASIPALLEGWKEVFGVRLSDADLKVLQDKLPSLGKSVEANKAIVRIMKRYAGMTLLRSKIAADIKSKNGGLRPLDYANKIEARFDDVTKPIKIYPPDSNEEIEIPAYKLTAALKKGARLVNE